MTYRKPGWTRDASLDLVRRLGQALWMLVGTSVSQQDLYWARGLLGDNGQQQLFDELNRYGALTGADNVLSPDGLAIFLCSLVPQRESTSIRSRVVWTLPPAMAEFVSEEDTYGHAAVEVIDAAEYSTWLVSPFLEARGLGQLLEALRKALQRGVHIQLITHGAESITDRASAAIEQLRREAVAIGGRLTVFTVKADAGLLVHSKLVVVDTTAAVLGSANLTNSGFSVNLETGVVLTNEFVREITCIIKLLLESDLVEQTFSTQ